MGLATEDGDGLPEEDALQVIVDRGPILLRAREGHAPNSAKTEGGVRVFCPSSCDFNPNKDPLVAQVARSDPAIVAASGVAVAGFLAEALPPTPVMPPLPQPEWDLRIFFGCAFD